MGLLTLKALYQEMLLYLSITRAATSTMFPWHHLQPPPATRTRHLACLQLWEQSAVTSDHDHSTPGPFLANFHVNYLGKTRAVKTENGKIIGWLFGLVTSEPSCYDGAESCSVTAAGTRHQTSSRGASSSVETCPEVSLRLRLTPSPGPGGGTVVTGDAVNLRQLIRHVSKFWQC